MLQETSDNALEEKMALSQDNQEDVEPPPSVHISPPAPQYRSLTGFHTIHEGKR